MLTPSRYSVMYCDVAPVHVSVTRRTVAKKFCPLAVKVERPYPGRLSVARPGGAEDRAPSMARGSSIRNHAGGTKARVEEDEGDEAEDADDA